MSRINVLYMIDSLGHGGAELQLLELIRNLDQTRFSAHICTLQASDCLYDELEIPKCCLGFISFTDRSLFGVVARLNRFIKANRIQIIQTFFQDPFLLAAISRPFHRARLVGTFLDLGFWRTSSETKKMQFAYKFFAGFIANSEAVKDHFVQTDCIDSSRITVIYNGFDLSGVPDPLPGKEAGSAQVVGIVANLNRPVKRVHDFVKAAALVRREVPDACFLVVGDGHLRGELEALAQSLGLGESISFTGRITKPLHLINSFDVGVLTSESEGFSNALIEYMACGVPVVATEVGGNLELVSQGTNGYLVPVGMPEMVSEAIVQLLTDRTLLARMGSANRRKIAERYGMPVMMEQHSAYYSRLLALR